MNQKLSDYLPDLLTHFECVIIPEFGGFVTQNQQTVIDEHSGINPPRKNVLFNAHLNHNDGLLANYLAQKENISYTEALQEIKLEVERMYAELDAGKVIRIEKVGDLRSINDRLIFKAYDDENYLLDSFGLGGIKTNIPSSNTPSSNAPTSINERVASPVNTSSAPVDPIQKPYTPTLNPKLSQKEAKEKREKKIAGYINTHLLKKNIKRYVVPTILALIILLLISSVFIFRDRLFEIRKPDSVQDTSIKIQNEGIDALADTLKETPIPQKEPVAKKWKAAPAPVEEPTEESDEDGSDRTVTAEGSNIYYCVASGSFTSEDAAMKEKRNLDMIGFTGDVIEIKNGTKYQVIIGRYENYDKAVTELKFAKSIDKRFYLLTVKPYRK